MRLALVRHAQRKGGLSIDDEGLSPHGIAQSQALARYLQKSWPDGSSRILSSPKRRCLETAAPIAESLGLKLESLSALDECLAEESSDSFEERVGEVITELRRATWGEQVILVSHSDWHEVASSLLVRPNALERARLKLDNAALHLVDLRNDKIGFLKKNFRPE
jgi:broad specificity phosphatase PhoE